jgi:hypothetical protein
MKTKIKPFKTKETHKTRLVRLEYDKEAQMIRNLCRKLSFSSRESSLSDRVKIRNIITSLYQNAERLEGGT